MRGEARQRIRRCGNPAGLAILVIAGLFAPMAQADAGVDLSAGSSTEEYVYTNAVNGLKVGSKSVVAQKITLSPWWSNDDWTLSADVPFIDRESKFSGTIYGWRYNFALSRLQYVPVGTLNGSERDTGIGDVWLNATRSWRPAEHLRTYVGGHLRAPTGSDSASPGSATFSSRSASRSGSFDDYALGKDGSDFRLAPGATLSNEYLWATLEPAFIWTSTTGEENRPAFYAGVGVTPWKYIEASVGFDYEDEIAAGSGELEQVSYRVTLRPFDEFAINASTYDDDDPSSPDSNWSIGVSASW